MQLRERRKAIRKYCMRKENKKSHTRHGSPTAVMLLNPQTKASVRKDKYEKNLIWYYCDIAYEGVRSDKDEEQLTRDTMLGDGAAVSDVPLGLGASLPDVNSDDEDDVEEEEDDEDEKEDNEKDAKEAPPKLGRRKTKEALDDLAEARVFNSCQ